MNDFLNYLLKSTLCLSLLYLVFRAVMRKESFFALNRMLLLAIVVASSVIPLLYLPTFYQSPVQIDLLPVFAPAETGPVALADLVTDTTVEKSAIAGPEMDNISSSSVITLNQLIKYFYLAGLVFSFLFLLRGLSTILMLFRKAKSIKMDGYRLLVIDKEIPAFSFGRLVVLSQHDYEEHRETLLAHEQAHIRQNHFFDLVLLEAVKISHWFNPVIYWLIKEMKEIHEFQADDFTLTNGIDASQYQLLIIQKGVGSQKFALANSFNHCQIKNRITMMNKQKPGKVWSWKVAIFLPLLALLLMAFGRKVESGTPVSAGLSYFGQVVSRDSTKQWSEADFLSLEGINLMVKMGKTPNWKEPEFSSFNHNGKWVTVKKGYFNGFIFCDVQIDSRSQLRIGNRTKLLDWKEFHDSIRTYVDYEVANNLSRPYFHQAMINGMVKMSPQCIFTIFSDKSTQIEDYQRFLNTIGNTILEIRGKYSLEIFKMKYAKLSAEQREQIDIIIPLMSRFIKTPQLKQEPKITKDSLYAGSKISEGKAKTLDSIQPKLYVVDGVITDQRRAKYFIEVGVESITLLNGKDATDKYGEKAKNGVVEITLKKENVKESNTMATENMVKGKVTDSSGKPLADASVVTGKVTLSDGRPLQRVPVRIKGTNTITLTDKDGIFRMADVPKNGMLEFQNVGLKSTDIKPDFEKPMNVKMELGSFWVDRVKVICQANDNNPPKPLPKHGFASNMKASPLLIVLDGVIVDKTVMDQIEPDDIKSVSILHANSATEKYGELAKNGVMEITTKGKVKLSAGNGNVVVEVNEYSDNHKMELHNNNIIDEMPEFKGGMKELMKYIAENIKYPDQAKADRLQGNVEVHFNINQNGKVENVEVQKATYQLLDAEASRVINAMPNWIPGKQDGKPVNVSFIIPIQFTLN